MSQRAVKHVRDAFGDRLRHLRKDRGLTQRSLGERAGLSGKFIGELERGKKSVSMDSLYHVSVALDVPLYNLTDLQPPRRTRADNLQMKAFHRLLSQPRKPEQLRRAYEVLKAMFSASR